MTTILRHAFLSVSALALTAGAAHAQFTLDIVHTNDVHSRIESINAYDSTCSEEDEAAGECFGGVARIKTMVDELKGALEGDDANVLLLDAGDQFQGSLFYTTYKGEAAAEFMNMTGYDVMAIGNHEFDDGPETLAAFIENLEAPVISGNTVAAEGSVLAGDYEPYVIEEFDGEKVAILSVLATDTDELSAPGNDISFEDEIEYLNEAVAEVEGQGINKIILLSHVGYVRDQQIAEAVEGIDAIVGGHSHTLIGDMEGAAGPYPTMVDGPSGVAVPIVTTSGYSKYVGELHLEFDDQGVVTAVSGTPHLLDASVTPNEEVAARVEELKAPIEELMTEYVADATDGIDGSRETCRQGECEMGNLVADAMLAHTADQGVQIAIQNGGGLRASIDSGEVTMGEVIAVLPFQNTLATFELTGAGIIKALENGASEYEEQAGRFAQVAGLRYTFDPTAPAGSRIVSVEIADGNGGFEPIDEEATYLVATNNYMRTGGDGYAVFEEEGQNAYDYGPGLEQVLADYLIENTPYEPYLDGRITNASAETEAAAASGDAEETTSAPAATEDESAEPAPSTGEAAETTADSEASSDEPAAIAPTDDMAAEEEPAAAPADEPAASEETATPEAADSASEAEEPADPMPPETTQGAPAPDTEGEAPSTMSGDEPADAPADMPASGEDATDAPSIDDATEPMESAKPAPAEETAPATEDAAPGAATTPEAVPAEAAEESGDREHVIVLGDTFWDLAEEYYGDGEVWVVISNANPEVRERGLEVGTVLVIPAQP